MLVITLCIVAILLIGYLLIATETFHHINKSAVAIFAGTICWLLYICEGSSFVMREHGEAYRMFLAGRMPNSFLVKEFIAKHVFSNYVGSACEIVLFLLATMTIVEVLNNNGCFDFITEWLRTRNAKRLLWFMAVITYLLSANLDNMTTAAMMLVIMHMLVNDKRQRLFFGAAIVIAANCGGAFTVIGDVTSLTLWIKGAVTPTHYAARMLLPSLVGWIVPTYLISRHLPTHFDVLPYKLHYLGDDTTLNRWQRYLMLIVGIGGLWFIPSFHRFTHLPPFVGAMCVLSLLWIVNELFHRKLLNSEQMFNHRLPRSLQYTNIQSIIFFIGIFLAVGAIAETGVLRMYGEWCTANIHNIYILSVAVGAVSSVLDSIVLVLSSISTFPVLDVIQIQGNVDAAYLSNFVQDGAYWTLLSFCSTLGGTIFIIGSLAGYTFMRIENVSFSWYIRHISGKVLLGWLLGLLVYFLVTNFLQ